MDLIGIPVRIVVGEKNLPNVEIKMRNQSEANLVPLEEATNNVVKMVQDELAKLNA
jgi:prolyl-tRNA synthetase